MLQFAGVEDFWSATYDPQAAMELVDRDSPVIALAHNPDTAPQLAAMGASWILTGHTHGRPTPDTRFWNAVYPTRQRQFVAGHYSLGPNRHLYVNRGIGNAWRVRAEHRPEITIFTLCPAAHAARRPGLPLLSLANPTACTYRRGATRSAATASGLPSSPPRPITLPSVVVR